VRFGANVGVLWSRMIALRGSEPKLNPDHRRGNATISHLCAEPQRSDLAVKAFREARFAQLHGCYCALIQLSDPVNLTDTLEKKTCMGLPSPVPRCSVEISREPTFL
jgi:hypothetical protein